jgi:hypothetical protein
MKKFESTIIKTNNVEDILFNVEKVSMESINGIKGGTSETSFAVVGDINGEKQILNVCSSRYNLVPNSEIFLPIVQELNARGIEYKVNFKSIDNVKFYGEFIITDDVMSIGMDEDKIHHKINIAHSYNGLLNYSINMGYYRLVCSNGLTIPVKGQEKHNFSMKGKHTPKMSEMVNQALDLLDRTITQKSLVAETFKTMANTKVTDLEGTMVNLMEGIKMNAVNARSGNKSNNFEYAMDIAKKEASKLDSDMNLWLVYNAVNNAIFSDELNSKHDEFRMQEDAKLMDLVLEMI